MSEVDQVASSKKQKIKKNDSLSIDINRLIEYFGEGSPNETPFANFRSKQHKQNDKTGNFSIDLSSIV